MSRVSAEPPTAARAPRSPRRYTAHLALLLLYALAVAGYFVLRYAAHGADSDVSVFNRAIQAVREQGTLLYSGGSVYPHGFAYQAASAALLQVTGLSVQTLQTIVWPLLAGLGLALVAFVFYAEIAGDRRIALLASFLLFLQPDVLFVTLRGSHEKFDWPLILLALTLLCKGARSPKGRTVQVLLFYLAVFALTSTNAFFATTFLAAIVLSLLFATLAVSLSHRRLSEARDLRRLIYVSLSCGILLFVFMFYLYRPAILYLRELNRVSDQIGATILSFEAPGQPYAYISYGWISRQVYLGLTAFTWLLIGLSFAEWARQAIEILKGRHTVSLENSLDWLLYAGFAFQIAVSIAVDYSGVLGQNLQLRVFPGFTILAVLMVARGARRVFSSLHLSGWTRRLALGLLLLAFAWFSVAALLKATNEPVLSNKWNFYARSEDSAIGWIEDYLGSGNVWSGIDERLREVYNSRHAAGTEVSRKYHVFTLKADDRLVLFSEREQLRGMRMGIALPLVDDWPRVYDNGDVYLYYRRPVTPYQR